MDESWRKHGSEWMDEYLEVRDRPILDGIRDQRLFEITLTPKGARFMELCDEYYGVTLTKEQIDMLITELQALSQKLGEQEPWKGD